MFGKARFFRVIRNAGAQASVFIVKLGVERFLKTTMIIGHAFVVRFLREFVWIKVAKRHVLAPIIPVFAGEILLPFGDFPIQKGDLRVEIVEQRQMQDIAERARAFALCGSAFVRLNSSLKSFNIFGVMFT